jgi:hypothetical protein
MNFPTFAKIRTEQKRGIILPFERTAEQETATENAHAASWSELIGALFDLWEDACMDALDIMCGRMTWDAIEIVEAEHSARLIQQLFEGA